MSDSKYAAILKWYTGKAQGVIRDYVLPTLAQAEADGYWPKGASRKVTAALNKQAIANKFARAQRREHRGPIGAEPVDLSGLLDDVCEDRQRPWKGLRASSIISALEFGQVTQATKVLLLLDKLEQYVKPEERTAFDNARKWAQDFEPVGKLIALLDSRRPPIVIVFKSLSPTVAANILRVIAIDLTTLCCPPIRYEWVTRMNKHGVEYQEQVGYIDWPLNTQFTSRFRGLSPAGNEQCHACGHAIKDRGNWVPLLAKTLDGKGFIGLWVGRDCARKLFGADVSGEGVFDGAPGTEKVK